MRRVGLLLFASLAAASTLAAQGKGIEKGTFEIGAFARYNKFPNVFEVTPARSDRWGFGGRLGYFFVRNLALEVDASSNPADLAPNQPGIPSTFNNTTSRPVLYTPIHVQFVYNAPISNRFQFLLGAGGNETRLSKGIKTSDIGFGGLAGIRWRALHDFSFRLEGTADVIPKGFMDKSNTYMGAQLGGSFLFGPGGGGCHHENDAISIRPTSATLQPGQTQTFSATAVYCGGPDGVVYRLNGPGTIDSLSGLYTAPNTSGSAQVIAYSHRGRMTSAAAVTIAVPPAAAPPPPPPPPPAPPPPPPPPPPPAAPPRYTFDLAMVHFRFDHADLTRGGIDTVNAIASTLKDHQDVTVDVVGHTDWIGTEAYNMKLSRARAETVRRLLVKDGVADSRITVKFHGKDEPVADNKTAAGRALNRRVEVKQNN
jgi:outer membrane protein OmpA-like peptidoglycan-associated protein